MGGLAGPAGLLHYRNPDGTWVAAYALVVDAKGENAGAFYRHYGFVPCRDNPMTLYLSLGANLLNEIRSG